MPFQIRRDMGKSLKKYTQWRMDGWISRKIGRETNRFTNTHTCILVGSALVGKTVEVIGIIL